MPLRPRSRRASGLQVVRERGPRPVLAQVRHRRSKPLDYSFAHSTLMWVFDLDHTAILPSHLSLLASLRTSDHLGLTESQSLSNEVRNRVREKGWTGHRIVLLASARSFGYSFDPLSTYFCYSHGGELEGIVAEVHNTHSESRLPDGRGRGKSGRKGREAFLCVSLLHR